MRTLTVRNIQSLGLALLSTQLAFTTAMAGPSPWVPPNNAPPASGFFDTCLQLTDGTIMCHEIVGSIPGGGATHPERWHRLSPDSKGSYLNGTWDNPPIADMPAGSDANFVNCTPNCTYGPLFFASSLLADGKVVVIGGEDNVNQTTGVDTNIGFIYDPVNDNGNCAGCGSWSQQLGPPTSPTTLQPIRVGDAMGMVLQNGTFVLADINSTNMYALNETGLSFTALNPLSKNDGNSEEGWNILPNGTLLTVDASQLSVYEIYCPASVPSCVSSGLANTWTNAPTPVNFPNAGPNTAVSIEVGPAITRPDGTVVQFSANPTGVNGVYNIASNSWSTNANMNFPVASGTNHFSVGDGPAAPLLNGNVLVMASPVSATAGPFQTPSHFYEFSFTDNTLSGSVGDTPNASGMSSFDGHMLVIPTGEILLTACHQVAIPADVDFYENGGAFQDAWRPVITSVVPTHIAPSASYAVTGILFNGFSQGSMFGDDSQSSSNYPLVRITNNATGDVSYARTHDHSRMGIEAVGSADATTTHFDTRGDIENGPSTLVVVANGIPSQPVDIDVFPNHPPVAVCKPFTTSASATCLGSITPGNVDGGSSDPDGDPLTSSVTPPGPFGLGSQQVTLTVTDPSGASASCVATVTVIDSTPPVLTVPGPVVAATCTDGATVQVGQATATDNCATNLKPTGQVIAKNGIPLVPPIPVVNGQVTLGIGTFTIQWTVSDGSNPPVTGTQTVVVGTRIQASRSFLLDDRAQVQNSGGGFGAVLNSGTGLTQIGNDSRSGAILSVGSVNILHRAVVNGNVTSASTVTKATDGTVNGSITMNATVVLPPLPTLPAFPPPTLGGFTVNSGTTQSHPPGSYTTATTINGGTLILAAGDYFFQSLTINSGSTVRATPETRVFVENALIFNAPFRASSGTAIQAITFGFAGANLSLLAQFNGTLIAPNADVIFGTGAGITYTGSFFGRTLEVTPASNLVCSLN
jgi:hypothetical protein